MFRKPRFKIRNRIEAITKLKEYREETFKPIEEQKKIIIEEENKYKKKNNKMVSNDEEQNDIVVEKNEPMNKKEKYKFLDDLDKILSEFKPPKKTGRKKII